MSPKRLPSTRVLVVDDHPIVRLGIRQMLAADPDLEVCAEADSVETALAVARKTHPALAIVDLSLAQSTGLELIRALREAAPGVSVLVLSMHDEALYAERVLRAGARGYIMKQEAIAGLLDAIHHVLAGRIFVSERMSQRVLERVGQEKATPPDQLASLTDRELEVFHLIGRGVSTATIADQLHVSVKTVETYRSNIKTKLELTDATDLVRFATIWSERL